MDKQKLRGARRAGFIYGLFRAAPIPTEILPRNLAKEAFEQMDEKAPSNVEEMRRKLKDEMGLDAIGFIPTRDRRGVQMIHQPYQKKARAQEDDELVIEPDDYAELEIEMEDPNDLVVDVDEDMKASARLRKAQREYMKDKRRKAKKAAKQALDSGARSLGDVFMMSQMAAPEPFSMKKKK